MTNIMLPDYQRRKMYRWENGRWHMGYPDDPEYLVERLWALGKGGAKPPKLEMKPGKRRAVSADYRRWSHTITCYQKPTQATITHETAHALAYMRLAPQMWRDGGHGPFFARVYAELLSYVSAESEIESTVTHMRTFGKLNVAEPGDFAALEAKPLTSAEYAECVRLVDEIQDLTTQQGKESHWPDLGSWATSNPRRAHLGNAISGRRRRLQELTLDAFWQPHEANILAAAAPSAEKE